MRNQAWAKPSARQHSQRSGMVYPHAPKSVLFHGEHRAALDDIAGLSTAMKRADRYNNNSNTGVIVGGTATLGSGLAGLPVTIAAVLGQVGMGAVLGSPRLAKFIASLSRKPNEKAALAHMPVSTTSPRPNPSSPMRFCSFKRACVKPSRKVKCRWRLTRRPEQKHHYRWPKPIQQGESDEPSSPFH